MFLLLLSLHAQAGVVADLAEWQMPSGLSVLHNRDARFPIVRVVVSIGVGTADAPAGKKELAHLSEHVWFRSDVDGYEVETSLRALGCQWNGSTSLSITNYWMECPSEAKDMALQIALHIAGGRMSLRDPGLVDSERWAVWQEASWSDDGGGRPTYRETVRNLFPASHPYAVFDDPRDAVEACTAADVTAFVQEHYRPERAVIVASGDITEAELAESLTRHRWPEVIAPGLRPGGARKFTAEESRTLPVQGEGVWWFLDPANPTLPLRLPSAPDPVRNVHNDPPPPARPRSALTLPVELPRTTFAWSLPGADIYSYWPMSWLGPLADADVWQALRDVRGVEDAWCFTDIHPAATVLSCTVEREEDADPAPIERAMTEVFSRPFTLEREAALDEVAGDTSRRFIEGLERDSGGVETAEAMAEHRLLTHVSSYYTRKYASSGATEQAAYLKLAERWLKPGRMTVIEVTPGVAASRAPRLPEAPQVARSAVPPTSARLPEMGSASLLGSKDLVLSNGLHVIYAELEGFARSSWRLVTPAPRPGQRELASLYETRLVTPPKYAGQYIPTWSEVDVSEDYAVHSFGWMRGLFEPEGLALQILATFNNPKATLDAAAVNRRRLSAMRRWRVPEYWRDQAWATVLDPNDPIDGVSPEALSAGADLPTREVTTFLEEKLDPRRATLVIAGQAHEETPKLLEKWLDAWSYDIPALTPPSPTPRPLPAPSVVLLDSLTSGEQVEIAALCPIDGAAGPQGYIARRVIAEVADTRAWGDLRERLGSTYSPSADTYRRWGGADLVIRASAPVTATARLLQAIRGLAASLTDAPPGEDELAHARRASVLSEISARSSTFAMSSHIADLVGAGLTLEDIQRWPERLGAVDTATFQAHTQACKEHTLVVIIGPQQAVQEALTAAGVAHTVVDWRAAHLERVQAMFPSRVAAEKKILGL